MDRCFFWLREARAPVPSTGSVQAKLLKTTVQHTASAGGTVTASGGTSTSTVCAPEGSLPLEGGRQQRRSAAQMALALHRLVQSAASRAQRDVHSSPAFPRLQISGMP